MNHHCHATGCTVPCVPERLMCPRHWGLVPLRIQRMVWRTYRPGQCDDKQPSAAWHLAADAAIGLVARYEGKAATLNQRKAMRLLSSEELS